MQARIDFDEDLPPMDAQLLRQRLAELKDRVSAALDTSQRGKLLSTGLQVAPHDPYQPSLCCDAHTGRTVKTCDPAHPPAHQSVRGMVWMLKD